MKKIEIVGQVYEQEIIFLEKITFHSFSIKPECPIILHLSTHEISNFVTLSIYIPT